MHQVKVTWPELSIPCMAATPQRKRKKEKKQINLQYLQSKKKRYLQTNLHSHMHTIHSHHYSAVTFCHTLSSVTQSVPLLSSHTISSVTQQLPPVTHLQSHMMLDTQPESILA